MIYVQRNVEVSVLYLSIHICLHLFAHLLLCRTKGMSMGSLLELKDPVTSSPSIMRVFLDFLSACKYSKQTLFFEFEHKMV